MIAKHTVAIVDEILRVADSGNYEIEVDLEKQALSLPDGSVPDGSVVEFEYDSFRKHCLLNGLDDIDYILEKKEAIVKYRASREDTRYYNTLSGE